MVEQGMAFLGKYSSSAIGRVRFSSNRVSDSWFFSLEVITALLAGTHPISHMSKASQREIRFRFMIPQKIAIEREPKGISSA